MASTVRQDKIDELKSILPKVSTLKCQSSLRSVNTVICMIEGKDRDGEFHSLEFTLSEMEAIFNQEFNRGDEKMVDLKLHFYDNRTVTDIWAKIPRNHTYVNVGMDIEEGHMACSLDGQYQEEAIKCDFPRR